MINLYISYSNEEKTLQHCSKIVFNTTKFPAGEININIINNNLFEIIYDQYDEYVDIGFKIEYKPDSTNNLLEDLFIIAHLKNAIDKIICNSKTKKQIKISLNLFYLPFSRYDRHMAKNDSCGLVVFSEFINSLKFDYVSTLDVHSSASELLIKNLSNTEQKNIISLISNEVIKHDYIICPDAGASKKLTNLPKEYPPVLSMHKVRNLSTGEIVETKLMDDVVLNNKSVIIIDDLCDGGRTFIEIAKVLKDKGCKRIELYVTHGIFSKGVQCLISAGISKIYTVVLFDETLTNNSAIEQITINN